MSIFRQKVWYNISQTPTVLRLEDDYQKLALHYVKV